MTTTVLQPTGGAYKVLFKTDEGDVFIIKLSDTLCGLWKLDDAKQMLQAAQSIALHLPSSKMLPNEESPDGDPIYAFATDNGTAEDTLERTLERL